MSPTKERRGEAVQTIEVLGLPLGFLPGAALVSLERVTGALTGTTPRTVRLGEDVTAVLTAAEQAAAQTRETALREAEQTKLAAGEKAAATLADAEARRAEAD